MSIDNLNQTAASPAADNSQDSAAAENNIPTEDFGAMFDAYEERVSSFAPGDVVKGTVVGLTDTDVIIDIGFKSEGAVPRAEFTDEAGNVTVKPGDEVDVVIKSLDNMMNGVVLSHGEAVARQTWGNLEHAFNEKQVVKGKVVGRTKGGLLVEIEGIQAFLPGSQVDVRPIRNLDSLKNKEVEAHVIKFNRKRGNVVLSRKSVLEEENSSKKTDTLSNLEEGYIVEGQIKNLTEYGAFVDLGGIDGLLHVTDMAWGRVNNPGDVFKVGENVRVKVLKFDRDKERISLGYKQLLPDPWSTVNERYFQGQRVKGKISNVTDYGAFVELEDGVEGLVHVTEMSWSKRMKHPNKMVNVGQDVEAVVLDVDANKRRVSLGIKQIESNPWDTLPERYQIGQQVHGKVRNLTDFGAFVEVEDGIDGLVHVSDISWTKRIKHPSEALKKGQEIDAIITNIDTENRRLSLSIKDLEPNAWDKFFEDHRPGDVVKGKVTRFISFGVFVELADEIEGLCHISELSDQRVERPEDAVQIGQELQFKILKLDPDQKRIGLSARAATHTDEEDDDRIDVRSYLNNEDSGMTRLGDLANFNFSKKSN
ncbi:MAG TPA: 30S ribosomal protein S1 [Blastocatellia bacterium]|nr:30S ribosomal protein S1 [Blastocatellia bacterium]